MTDTEIAYLAGFFDGEGCILIQKHARAYWLEISAVQIDPAPLKLLSESFGGRIVKKPDHRGFRSRHSWRITSDRAFIALQAMLPFLMIKRAEADLGIQFQQRMSIVLPHTVEAVFNEREIRDAIRLQMQALKRRDYENALDDYQQFPEQSIVARRDPRLLVGETQKQRFPHNPERLEQIREWRRDRESWSSIAIKLSITPGGVQGYIDRWGDGTEATDLNVATLGSEEAVIRVERSPEIVNDADVAYLAGFFDGEGCIIVHKNGRTYWFSISASQINPEPLKRLSEYFGGRIFRDSSRPGLRSRHLWRLTSLRALAALEAMLPFLTVKRDEAVLAVQFQEQLSKPKSRTLVALTENQALNEESFLQMKALKRRSHEHALDLYAQSPRQSLLGRKGPRLSAGKGSSVKRPDRRHPYKPERLDEIRKRRRAKETWGSIAKSLGITKGAAKQYIIRWGI